MQVSRQQLEKASWFLLFPWSLLSIVLIIVFNSALGSWFGRNWSWITIILIIPAAIFENLKIGFSTMQVMYLKILFSLLSFMIVGITFGISLAGWYYARFQNYPNIPRVNIPWYVLLALWVMLGIEAVQIFSMLKAVKRQLLQFDENS